MISPVSSPVTSEDSGDPSLAKEDQLNGVMARCHYAGDSLIEVLHAAQLLYGYLPSDVLRRIAHKLKLPPSRVLGAASFYHLFRFAPEAPHSVAVCLGSACYVAGAENLLALARKCPDWSLATGRCVGSCGLAPLVVCDGVTLPRATPELLESQLTNRNDRRNAPADSSR